MNIKEKDEDDEDEFLICCILLLINLLVFLSLKSCLWLNFVNFCPSYHFICCKEQEEEREQDRDNQTFRLFFSFKHLNPPSAWASPAGLAVPASAVSPISPSLSNHLN